MPVARILCVTPNSQLGASVRTALETGGYGVVLARFAIGALSLLAREEIDLVIADEGLEDMSTGGVAVSLARSFPGVPLIVVGAAGAEGTAKVLQEGAADYVALPLNDDELLFTVRKVLASRPNDEEEPPPSRLATRMILQSGAMFDVIALADRAARSQATVLVQGESGTGKELVARHIHDHSPRAGGPFVKVHCAALPDQLLESELFGYEKGAFTGAASRKPGRVELADKGTLFLDEIGDISAATQVKLLRILQDRQYERLGGTTTLTADVRFVAATHRNLVKMVKEGTFREDLYYRLNVVSVVVPPLRERPEDIAPLVEHFAQRAAAVHGVPRVRIAPDAMRQLERYSYPGNVRQLQNMVERLVILADAARVTPEDVQRELSKLEGPATAASRGAPLDLKTSVIELDEAVRRAERHVLEKALKRAGGNRSAAARILGVSRRTLYNKLTEHGLS